MNALNLALNAAHDIGRTFESHNINPEYFVVGMLLTLITMFACKEIAKY